MKRFVIERDMPGVGKMSAKELQDASGHSNKVLCDLGQGIQWDHSYVTGDKIYCVYLADSEKLIRDHATKSGFPANKISEVRTIIDPTTANA